jgi:outer membrane protein assembly factor BamB
MCQEATLSNAERRYYIVVPPRRSTISGVVLALVTLAVAALWGQQPKVPLKHRPLPILPAVNAWQYQLPSPPSAGGALDARHIYIPLESQQIVALERETGNTVWIADVESVWPPVAAGDSVFVAASDEIHALDALSGTRRWRIPIARAVAAPMMLHDGKLLVPVAPDEIIALAAADGARVWRKELGGTGGRMMLAAGAQGIFITLMPNRVIRLSPDGRIVWDRRIEGVVTPPALARDRVIVGSSRDLFHALDPGSGKEKWTWSVGGDPVGAAADQDFVFLVALDNTVRGVNRGNGHQRWREPLTARPTEPPAAFVNTVVVTGESPALAAFNGRTGEEIGTYDAPARLRGAPLVDPAPKPFSVAVIVIMRDGNVIALRSRDLQFAEQPATRLTGLPGRALPREPSPAAPPLR